MDDKTGAEMLKTFMRQPVSTFNAIVLIVLASGWYFTRENNMEKLSSAAKAQESRIERVEAKVDAAERNDVKQNAEITNALHAIANRLSVVEADARWLVRQQGGPARP